MKAIFLQAPGCLALTEIVSPSAPNPDEAIVRVAGVGICGSDLHAYKGEQNFINYPLILGHELGVEVIAIGANASQYGIAVGDRCAVIPYMPCGHCIACRNGKTNCCVNLQLLGVHVDGGMREQFAVPLNLLIKANTLSFDLLAIIEMLSVGAHAVKRSQIQSGEKVLVIGAGPIGLATAAFAQLAGADIALLELSDFRIEFCRQQSMNVIDGKSQADSKLRDLTDGQMFPLVFDATGSAASMMNALNYVAHGGRLIYAGHVKGELTFKDPEMHKRELTLYCSRNATPADFKYVIGMLEKKQVDVNRWITHRVSPEGLIRELPSWLEPGSQVVKAVLEF
ncbi:L-gulonate 5-dehydrogenase [Anaerolineae bacterium]|nr:L-gulonate 5-dehydrogenase [Anaerolineae bacterium]